MLNAKQHKEDIFDISEILAGKYFLPFDCETTGTYKARYKDDYSIDESIPTSAMVTISGAIIKDMEVKEYFDFRMRPFEGAHISSEALKVTGFKIEGEDSIMDWPDPSKAMKDLEKLFVW